MRIEPQSGALEPFVSNAAPGPASRQGATGRGLERPFDVQFGPDGAMYIVDYGVVTVDMSLIEEGKPPYSYEEGTGTIWRVTRDATDFGTLPETYARNYQDVVPLPQVTESFPTLSEADAYDFQRAYVAELAADGFTVNGYKLGFTGEMLPFGTTRSIYGRMFGELQRDSGATIDIGETFVGGNIGFELILVLDDDIEDLPTGEVSAADVADAVARVVPAVEFPDLGFDPPIDLESSDDYLDIIAANAGSRLYVTGAPMDVTALGDLDAIPVRATLDGEATSVDTTAGASLRFPDGQYGALAFLVNVLRENGDPPLQAGDLVFSGALGGDAPADENLGAWVGDFGPLGQVDFTLTDSTATTR